MTGKFRSLGHSRMISEDINKIKYNLIVASNKIFDNNSIQVPTRFGKPKVAISSQFHRFKDPKLLFTAEIKTLNLIRKVNVSAAWKLSEKKIYSLRLKPMNRFTTFHHTPTLNLSE